MAPTGVSVKKGEEEVHIHAPMVISNAGIFNTYQKLLPKELQTTPGNLKNKTKQKQQSIILEDVDTFSTECHIQRKGKKKAVKNMEGK